MPFNFFLTLDMSKNVFSKTLFWDSDPARLDYHKNKFYIIERIITRGDYNDWKKLFQLYSPEEIKKTIVKIKDLDPKTLSFVSNYFDIPKKKFECDMKPYWTEKH